MRVRGGQSPTERYSKMYLKSSYYYIIIITFAFILCSIIEYPLHRPLHTFFFLFFIFLKSQKQGPRRGETKAHLESS
jgi:hypothetical protein